MLWLLLQDLDIGHEREELNEEHLCCKCFTSLFVNFHPSIFLFWSLFQLNGWDGWMGQLLSQTESVLDKNVIL